MGEVTPHPAAARPSYAPPRPINPDDDLSQFDCEHEILNTWLRDNAKQWESRTARTYVVCQGNDVAGYYCLSSGTIARIQLPNAKTRNGAPDPVPVIVIGRLAVDKRHKRQRIGKHMLKDALLRAQLASQHIGAMAVVVHAIDDQDAINFYLKYKFIQLPNATRTFFLPIASINAAITGP